MINEFASVEMTEHLKVATPGRLREWRHKSARLSRRITFESSHTVAPLIAHVSNYKSLSSRLQQVKDICNELDVKSLCHKILQNVSLLLNADRGSLFLVQGKSSGGNGDAPKK